MSTSHLNSVRLRLCDALSSEPAVITKLANHLQEKNLITESTRQDVIGTQGVKPYDQANKLADAVISRLNDPQNATVNWNKLLAVLRCCGLSDLAEKLDLEKSDIQSKVVIAVTFLYLMCAYVLSRSRAGPPVHEPDVKFRNRLYCARRPTPKNLRCWIPTPDYVCI